MLFLFLSHPYPSPRYTIYLLLVLCPLLHPLGDSCPLFLFVQSLKSDEEAESAKGPQNELFEAKGKALASCLVLSPVLRKLQQLGLWTVSQPSIISWEACSVDGVLGGPLLQGGSSYEAATAFQHHLRPDPQTEIIG